MRTYGFECAIQASSTFPVALIAFDFYSWFILNKSFPKFLCQDPNSQHGDTQKHNLRRMTWSKN